MDPIHNSQPPAGVFNQKAVGVHIDDGRFFGDMWDVNYHGLDMVLDWDLVSGFGLHVNDHACICMLLLQYLPRKDTYIRVGLATNVPKAWFNAHATECTVTIE
jgi:hypothetical protein